MIARYHKHTLNFKRPGGTSRGILTRKDSWFLILEKGTRKGIGECSILKGLSPDDRPDFEERLKALCTAIEKGSPLPDLTDFPAIRMGYETAQLSLAAENPFELFPSAFTKGQTAIPINGLVWMGSYDFMKTQLEVLLENGFDCIKLKIGAIDFDQELDLIATIRANYPKEAITIRVDANGAFSPTEAQKKLEALSKFDLHSIEQPIAAGQWEAMSDLCRNTPIAIALDEELIGQPVLSQQEKLLNTIAPQYIILKPSLLGGLAASEQWIQLAEARKIGWWATSALESNIGLNAIAQWVFSKQVKMPQGLGTGSLFSNNIDGPLVVKNGYLISDISLNFNTKF